MAHDQPEFSARSVQRDPAKIREEVHYLAGLVKQVDLVKQADQERLSATCAELFAAFAQNSDLEIYRTARELALRCAQFSRESLSPQIALTLEEFSVLLADHVGALETISEIAQAANSSASKMQLPPTALLASTGAEPKLAEVIQALMGPRLTPSAHTVRGRRPIQHPRDRGFVTIIQEGWAAASITLPDGRRQIVSFLLPGDIVSPENLYDATSDYRVESVGEVTSHSFEPAGFREALHRSSDLFEAFIKAWAARTSDLNQLALDLGRGTAQEKISRLLLNLMERLTKLGKANGREMPFPLRRHHIADATGLTSVYVSKMLCEFRSAKLISLGDRSLTIADPNRLHRLAAWPRIGHR